MGLAQAGDAKASPKPAATIPAHVAAGRSIRNAVWEKYRRNLRGGNHPALGKLAVRKVKLS